MAVLVKFTAAVVVLLHIGWSAGLSIVGVGLTVMVKDSGVPGQLLSVGVTVIVPIMGVLPGLVAVNEAISPLPLVPRPMDVWVFVQL